jgi:hypothetical protein
MRVAMHRSTAILAGSILAVAIGCSFSTERTGIAGGGGSSGSGTGGGAASGGRGGGSGASTGSGGNATGVGGGAGDIGSPDMSCGQSTFGTQNIPPDVLIILDKSGSMANDFNDMRCNAAGCVDKWTAMTAALNQVVGNTQGNIRWGLKFFANTGACGITAGATVAIGLNNATAIANAIAGVGPTSNTPTRAAEDSGVQYLMTLTDPNPRYILLATDGQPNCMPGGQNATADDAGAIQAVLNASTAGFPTFVVGIGNVATAMQTLNQMATNGGKAQPADAMGRIYYPADNQAGLVTALDSIQTSVRSCTFTFPQAPPDPTNIVVEGDNIPIAQDPVNGWSYTDNTSTAIVLNGTSCASYQSGAIQSITANFGCLGVPVVP